MGIGVFEGLLRSTASEFVPEELHGICKVGGFTAVGYLTTLGSNGGSLYGFAYSLVYPTMHHVSRVFLGRHSAIIDRIIQFSIETFFNHLYFYASCFSVGLFCRVSSANFSFSCA